MAKFQTRNSTGLQNSNPGICRTPELQTRNPPESGIPCLSYPEFRWTPAGIQTGPGIPLEFRRNSGPIFTREALLFFVDYLSCEPHGVLLNIETHRLPSKTSRAMNPFSVHNQFGKRPSTLSGCRSKITLIWTHRYFLNKFCAR